MIEPSLISIGITFAGYRNRDGKRYFFQHFFSLFRFLCKLLGIRLRLWLPMMPKRNTIENNLKRKYWTSIQNGWKAMSKYHAELKVRSTRWHEDEVGGKGALQRRDAFVQCGTSTSVIGHGRRTLKYCRILLAFVSRLRRIRLQTKIHIFSFQLKWNRFGPDYRIYRASFMSRTCLDSNLYWSHYNFQYRKHCSHWALHASQQISCAQIFNMPEAKRLCGMTSRRRITTFTFFK